MQNRAAVLYAPYDIRLEERPVPHVGPHDVLVEVTAVGVCGSDVHYYLRGGASLPTGPALQWTDQGPLAPLTLHVYPDEDGQAAGRLYEDDGISLAYERGERWATTYACVPLSEGQYHVRAERDGPPGHPTRRVMVQRYGSADTRAAEVPDDAATWQTTL